jgi:hypothetical protein
MRIPILVTGALLSAAFLGVRSDSSTPTQPMAGSKPEMSSSNAVDGAELGFTASWAGG